MADDGAWQVAMAYVPVLVDGAPGEGWLLVLGEDGTVRHLERVARGGSLGDVVRAAAASPASGVPCPLPARISCSDRKLLGRLRAELPGVAVEPVDHLPAASAAVMALCMTLPPLPQGMTHLLLPSDELIRGPHEASVAPMLTPSGEERTALVLRMAKRSAVRLAADLQGVDAVALKREPHGVDVRAVRDGEDVGLLTLIRGSDAEALAGLPEGAPLTVIVAAGGTKRPDVRPGDILSTLDLPVAWW